MHKKDFTAKIIGICIIIGLFLLMCFGIYECPLRCVVGIPCPLCGMFRAFMNLIKGDLAKAFYYHPLWPVVVVAVVVALLKRFRIIHLTKRQIDIACIIIAVLFVMCYVWRMTHGLMDII